MPFAAFRQLLDDAIRCHQAGQLTEAEQRYRQVIASEPANASALHLLGALLHETGRRTEGMELLRRAIDHDPSTPLYHLNIGSALVQEGRVQEAMIATRTALALSPQNPQAHFNLGWLLEMCDRAEEAAAHYRQAIAIRSDFAAAHNNLGNVLHGLGQLEEAEQCYRQALQFQPSEPKRHRNLARAMSDRGRLDEAAGQLRQAIVLDSIDPESHRLLGDVLASADQYDQAVATYRRALELRPTDTMAMARLGDSLQAIGRLDEAIAWFRKAVATSADHGAGSCLNLAIHLHPAYDAAAIAAEHRHWEMRFASPFAPLGLFFGNNRNPDRRLRVGYVSPSLNDHSVGRRLLPLLLNHDHEAVEIVCYSDTRNPDWMTDRIRRSADSWRSIVGFSDDQLTSQVRHDQIDILVDLSAHREHNRLLVFARKPAPVQMTGIGYPASTGLRTIDYRLSDAFLDPPEADGGPGPSEPCYSERTIRLPDTFCCYQPADDLPPPSQLPALGNGHFTFGCLNRFSKMTDQALLLWSNVLRNSDNSRLLLLAPSGSARARVLQFFDGEGINGDRIGFLDRRPYRQYMELYSQLDLCLDTVPYTGHSTTVDALWMGVPVISLVGTRSVSRGGLSILSNVGLEEFCTSSPEDFVKKASEVARDSVRLAALRSSLRDQVRGSPLMDGRRFARNVETAYRKAWQAWCGSTIVGPVRVDQSDSSVTVGKTPYRIVVLEPPGHVWSAGLHELARLLELSLRDLGFGASVTTNTFSTGSINLVLGYYGSPPNPLTASCSAQPVGVWLRS